jgi:hypothetical protein
MLRDVGDEHEGLDAEGGSSGPVPARDPRLAN